MSVKEWYLRNFDHLSQGQNRVVVVSDDDHLYLVVYTDWYCFHFSVP